MKDIWLLILSKTRVLPFAFNTLSLTSKGKVLQLFLLGFRPCFPVYMQEILSTRDSPICHTRVKAAENIHFESFSHVGIFCISSSRWGMFFCFHRGERSLKFCFFFLASGLMVSISRSFHVLSEISSGLWGVLEFALHPGPNTQWLHHGGASLSFV